MTITRITGKRIKDFRLKRGWTQSYAAVQLGISLRTIVALERGTQRSPRPLTLAKIALAMESIEKAA